jgi:hypothetical protein
MNWVNCSVCCCGIIYLVSTILFAVSFGTIGLNKGALKQNIITKKFSDEVIYNGR